MKKSFLLIAALAVAVTVKATVITTINSVADLQALATSVNSGEDYTGVTVTLATDLSLIEGEFTLDNRPDAASSWTPIGTTAHPFKGTFDGGGHTITNLFVWLDGSVTGNVAGLFGKIEEGGIVKDVHIKHFLVYLASLSPNENVFCAVGSIAGYNQGTIIGCSNTAEIWGNWNNASVGGIAGENGSKGVIQNCYNLGEVYTDGKYTGNKLGGIVGENNCYVQNCFAKAVISAVGFYGQICGNSGGTVTGCFYVGGQSADLVLNNASANSLTLRNELTLSNGRQDVLLSGRTIYGDGAWNTLCLPFDIPTGAAGRSPIAGAEVKQLKSSDFSNGTLTLEFEDVTSIEAGKPYIVKWADTEIGDLSNPVFLDVTISSATSNSTVMPHWVDFVGIYDPMSFDDCDDTVLYLGSKNNLYYPSGAFTINAFRAYFKLKDGLTAGEPPTSSGIRSFVLNFDGDAEAAGVAAPLVHWTQDASWSTLGGQRLAAKPTRPGLYIQQGRKVIVK